MKLIPKNSWMLAAAWKEFTHSLSQSGEDSTMGEISFRPTSSKEILKASTKKSGIEYMVFWQIGIVKTHLAKE